MPIKKINQVAFNYELVGNVSSYPPFVLIPGYATDINLWRSIAENLAVETKVLIFDNQGIGHTQDDRKNLTLEDMAENIKALINGLLLYKPIIVGFALGGIIAQKLAHDYPDSFTQLILLNTVMSFNEKAKQFYEQFCVLREQGNLATYAQLLYDTVFSSEYRMKNNREKYISSVISLLEKIQSAEGQRRQVEVLKRCNSEAWASKIRVPTVVVTASEDVFALPEEGKALAETISKNATVEFKMVEKSGHSLLMEKPEIVVDLLKEKLYSSTSH